MAPRILFWIAVVTFAFLIAGFFEIKTYHDVLPGFWSAKSSTSEQRIPASPIPSPLPPSINIVESIASLSAPRNKDPISFPGQENSKQEGSTHRYELPGGGYFEGEFQNGKAYGHGSYTMPNGSRYDGELSEGLAEGKGTTLNKDGSRFEGNFHAGLPIGKGSLNFSDGTRFEGVIHHNVFPGNAGNNSEGVFTFTSGTTFEGSMFRDDDDSHISARGVLHKLPNQLPNTQIEIDGQAVVTKDQFHGTANLKGTSKQGPFQTEVETAMSKSGNAATGYFVFKNPDGSRWKVEIEKGIQNKFGTFTFPNGHTERRKIVQQPF